RKDAAIADAALPIDHDQSEFLMQRRILKSIVHDDGGGASGARHTGAGHTVARDDRRRRARQQERLVADFSSAMPRRIDANRTFEIAAITATEEEDAPPRLDQPAADGERRRRLASAADREIADADDRHADLHSGLAHAAARDRSVDRRHGCKQGGCEAGWLPPEVRVMHRATSAPGEFSPDRA